MVKAPKPPKPPPFYPIDIGGTARQAMAADVRGFQLSDDDFVSRFPGLVRARNMAMESAERDLTGPLDPELQGSFVRRGITQSLGAFGEGAGFDVGSAGANTATASMGRDILQNQDANRRYAGFLRQENPQRAFGLSGEDIANLSIFNTGNANQAAQNAYSAQVAGIQGQAASNMQNAQLLGGIISSVAGAYGGYQQRPKVG